MYRVHVLLSFIIKCTFDASENVLYAGTALWSVDLVVNNKLCYKTTRQNHLQLYSMSYSYTVGLIEQPMHINIVLVRNYVHNLNI